MPDAFDTIMKFTENILHGASLSPPDARSLMELERQDEVIFLVACANRIRDSFLGNTVEFCAIVNAKSGRCSEDCSFCAQSSHYSAPISAYPLIAPEAVLDAARRARDQGATRFSIVTSGKGIKPGRELDSILEAMQKIVEEEIRCCASLGIIDRETAHFLKQAGVSRYHHNLETARSHFKKICTTHEYDQRLGVLELCKEEGLEVCSGGILGMGESREQRLELAYTLADLGVDSVPINILNPITDTPLEKQPPLPPLEALKTIAVFRFVMPRTEIRTCGGRESGLRGLQPFMFTAGCTGTMIGNYLTTKGRSPAEDFRDARDLGLVPLGRQEFPERLPI